jgi:hypothetical protein
MSKGAPTRCYLPSCQKTFESSCFRGDDGHFESTSHITTLQLAADDTDSASVP